MNVVLLEFPDEVQRFFDHCRAKGRSPGDFHIVALWPNVQVALQRNGVSYVDTRAYFDNESHRRIILRSEEWLKIAERSIALTDGLGITETYNSTFLFHLRFYVNYFLWAIEVLEGITRKHDVSAITVCTQSLREGSPLEPTLGTRDRYLGSIAKLYAHGRDIPIEEIRTGPSRAESSRDPSSVLAPLNSLLHRVALARIRPGSTVLVNAVTYNMDRLMRELQQTFPAIRWVCLQTSSIPEAAALYGLFNRGPAHHFVSVESLEGWSAGDSGVCARLEEGLRHISNLLRSHWANEFRDRGVSFCEVFLPKIEGDLWPYMRSLIGKSRAIRYALQKVRPSLVLSPFAADTDALLGEWTRLLGIPSLSISHGTHTPSHSDVDEIEKRRLAGGLILTTFAHTALQSPLAEAFLTHSNGKRRPTPLRTGNLILARLDASGKAAARSALLGDDLAADKKIVVYATTLKPRSGLRFQIHETLDEHLAGIRDLASAMNEVKAAVLIVKLHPAAALKEDEVRMLVPETKSDRVRVMCRVPFEQVLSAADLLVSYSSTCIEEAMQNGVPVLLYDPWDRYQHLPAFRWHEAQKPHSSPAYYLNNAKSLGDALQWILHYHNPSEIPAEVWREYVYPPETHEVFLKFVAESLTGA